MGDFQAPAGEVLIDTVSVTFPRSEVERIVGGSVCGWTATNSEILERFQYFLNWLFGCELFQCVEIGGKRNGFDQTIVLDGKTGFFAWGGNNKKLDAEGNLIEHVEERVQLYIDGVGCARVGNWIGFGMRASSLRDRRITRVDVAFDDHDGHKTVNDCRNMYDAGLFTSTGRPPKAKHIDDMGSNEGCTFYVGKRENGKMLRCYEKGKQLGDPTSKWVRWEVEFSAKDRDIPFDVFTDPARFIAGAYPALSFISKVREVIRTCREKLDIQFNRLMKIAKVQYGKLLNFAYSVARIPAEEVFDSLVNYTDVPERLKWCVNQYVNVNPEELNHAAC